MLERFFAIVMAATAMPAWAGERASYSPAPDALRLLLLDESATSGSRAPERAPRLATPPTLAEFEMLAPPAAITPAGQAEDRASPFAVAADATSRRDWGAATPEDMIPTFGGRYAIGDAMRAHPRPHRARALLDTMVTLRLDGEADTRSFNVSGGLAGMVWGVLPGP